MRLTSSRSKGKKKGGREDDGQGKLGGVKDEGHKMGEEEGKGKQGCGCIPDIKTIKKLL